MAAPPTNIIRRTLWLDWVGNRYNIWMSFVWTEHETSNCHYTVERHSIADGTWEQVDDVDKGQGHTIVNVGTHAPPNWSYNQTHDQVRITCITIPDDGTPGPLANTFVFPVGRFRTALVNQKVSINLTGNSCVVNMNGIDSSYHIYQAQLKVYNMTRNIQLIYQRGPDFGTPILASEYCIFYEPGIGFTLTGGNIPSEGDRIQFHYWAIVGNGKYPQNTTIENDGIETVFTVTYTLPVNFPLVSLATTQGNTVSYDLRYAPGISGNPFLATFSATGLPPGVTLSSAGILSGTPTALGTYNVRVTTVSGLGDIGGGTVQVVVGVSTAPTILGPAGPLSFYQNVSGQSFQLIATNNPSSFAISSGSLPAGMSLDTTTGIVSGIPTTPQSATTVNFTASNVSGTGPAFGISIAVVTLALPVITSPLTATGYRGQAFNYDITCTNAFGPGGFTAAPLPPNLSLNAQYGYITGIIDSSNPPGIFNITLRAQNASGYGPPAVLHLTIADQIPVITSNLSDMSIALAPYTYQITASNFPVTFGADNLPFGLTIDTDTGLITGNLDAVGTLSITLKATNSAGTGTAILVLEVKFERPIIDTTLTLGKAITCETGIQIVFQPTAANSPTFWFYLPPFDGFTIDSQTGKLTGTFTLVGLYATLFYAGNGAGVSDPATFYFLVEKGPSGSIASLGSGLDIWIDVQDGSVSIMVPGSTMDETVTTTQNGTTTQTKKTVTAPTDPPILWSKRGDTLPLTIRFHKDGKPVTITNITSLIFGVREDFTLPYAVLYSGVNLNDDGSYAIYPNYGDNPEIDFEIDDTEEFLPLLAEVQWEANNLGDANFSRRSSQTFNNRIYRDVINPDDPTQ